MTAPFNQMEPLMTKAPVIPVITIDHIDYAIPLAKALVAGGLPVLEVTLRTECALESIRKIAEEVPDAIVGAGTVIHPYQMQAVADAGGQFCVSPGSTTALLECARDIHMQILPGAVTASEVMNLLSWGVTHMKFFPAETSGGLPALKNIGAPLPEARFCPTGGIRPNTAPDYLALNNVLCVGGTWVCPKDKMAAGDWAGIEALARDAAALK